MAAKRRHGELATHNPGKQIKFTNRHFGITDSLERPIEGNKRPITMQPIPPRSRLKLQNFAHGQFFELPTPIGTRAILFQDAPPSSQTHRRTRVD
jgi:hypothetical protein